MARILPAQIKSWTAGDLHMSKANRENTEHFYRGISTDTRSLRSGEIFLALKGERFDGHNFLRQAIAKGAGALVIERSHLESQKLLDEFSEEGTQQPDLLLVDDSLVAYGQIAAGYRQTLLASVIAITGSVGKTTTRRMVSEVISSQVHTHETVDNQNNRIGVPLTLLEADDDDDVIVAELGVDRPGEIKMLSQISKPDIAILTAIGYSHAAFLGSRENILKEKTDIISGMKSNGLVLINGQDDSLLSWARSMQEEISIWLVFNERPDPSQTHDLSYFWAENLVLSPTSTSFVVKTSLDAAIALPVQIPAPGKYLVRAAIFALACAYALGMDMYKAAEACTHFHNTGNRQNIVKFPTCLLIDDSYNASPESILSALETLNLLAKPGQRKIACLGGIRELGSYTQDLHRDIAKTLKKDPVDVLYLVGEEMKWLLQGLQEEGLHVDTHFYSTTSEIIPDLLEDLQADDVILIKGSRYYEMEKIHQAIAERFSQA